MSFTDPRAIDAAKRISITHEMLDETHRQIEKWGQQNWPMYTYPDVFDLCYDSDIIVTADYAKGVCDSKANSKELSWMDICNEEYLEAREEAVLGNKEALRMELIQIGACIISAIASLDRNGLEGA